MEDALVADCRGRDIELVTSGAAALDRLNTATGACVVLDHQLKDVDGLDCFATIGTRHPGLAVIVIAEAAVGGTTVGPAPAILPPVAGIPGHRERSGRRFVLLVACDDPRAASSH